MIKINLARKLDYWIGAPLCFIFSLINAINKAIPGKGRDQDKAGPKKILFLELSEMGSVILAYPAIKKAKELYPGALLYFWIFKSNQDVVHMLDIIPKENVITLRNDNIFLFFLDLVKNLRKIRKEKIDIVVDMELFSRITSVLSYLSGAPVRVGFYRFSLEGLYRGNMHTRKVIYNPYKHISLNFLALVHSLERPYAEIPMPKIIPDNISPLLPKAKAAVEAQDRILEKLKGINSLITKEHKIVILNPGSSQLLPLRRWPLTNYIKLANMLLGKKDVFIVIIGSEYDTAIGEKIIKELVSGHSINLTGRTTLRELVDLFSISWLFISHDSGPSSFSGLTDIRKIILFGPETPRLYEPFGDKKTIIYKDFSCSPCVSAYNHRMSLCKDNKCLQAVTVEEVYGFAEMYLEEAK